MKLQKIIKLSFNMLLHSKLRSWLTVLGIFIGVVSVIAIISLGQGLQASVSSQLEGLGQDVITITSGSGQAMGPPRHNGGSTTTNVEELSNKDIQTLKLVPGVKYINGIISGQVEVIYQSETARISLQGYDPTTFNEFVTTSLESGRYLGQGDANAIVIGNRLAHKVYTRELEVGFLLKIDDKNFRVVGILEPSTGFGGSDNAIYMSTKNARELLKDTSDLESDEYSSLAVKVNDPEFVEKITEKIEDALRNSHHVAKGKEDFSVISAAALQDQLGTITGFITLFLGFIAAISLLVGGIGVANTMFTSVVEKTRDIGVMKAIGAKNNDILLIFLFNSGMLGLIGGLLGVGFSVMLSLLIPLLGISLGDGVALTMPINIWLMSGGLAFSMGIGMISGAIPARSASKLKPVDALRSD